MTALDVRPRSALRRLSGTALLTLAIFASTPAFAGCDNVAPTSGQTVTCDTSAPNPSATGVQAAGGSSNIIVNVLPGSGITVNGVDAINLFNQNQVANSGALTISGGGRAIFALGDGNIFTNAAQGVISTTGANANAIAVIGNGNTLVNNGSITTQTGASRGLSVQIASPGDSSNNNTLINNGSIATVGRQSHGMYVQSGNDSSFTNTGVITTNGNGARAIYSAGARASIVNTGTLLTTGASDSGTVNNTVFMQGNANHLVNSGVIEARGLNSDGVLSNTVGSSFTAIIENLAGGRIISQQGPAIRTVNGATTITNAGLLSGGGGTAIRGGNGNITLTLQTGSQIVGTADGGGGANTVHLQGTGVADNPFLNFQTLFMEGADWTWRGTGDFRDSFINSGAFRLQNSLTGNVTIAAGTSLLAGDGFNPSITPYPGGPAISVKNAGTIDLTNGGSAATNTLTIVGNYVGQGGGLALRTVLGDDASSSDRLAISGGAASGTTTLSIANAGGAGALTTGNGIQVISAINGATTASGAFSLAQPVAAGAYEYVLYRGGVTAGSEQSWYLRSTAPPITPTTSTPATQPPQPAPITGGVAPPPAPSPDAPTVMTPDGPAVPLYRPEVAVNAIAPAISRYLAFATLGTFHERRGEQLLLSGGGPLPAGWGRVFGQKTDMSFSGDVRPGFKGHVLGLQAGLDLFGLESADGARDRFGLFYGFARAKGDVRGFAVGVLNTSVGRFDLDSNSIGGYWTHIGPSGWYVDAVLMHSWLSGSPRSDRGVAADAKGTALTASLEGGVPFAIGQGWILEPQAQLIWQRVSLDPTRDQFSAIAHKTDDAFTGRVGARLQGEWLTGGMKLTPYLKANVWRGFSGDDVALFDANAIVTKRGATSLEFGGGVVAEVSKNVGVYVAAGYTTNLGGDRRRTLAGNVGLRVAW